MFLECLDLVGMSFRPWYEFLAWGLVLRCSVSGEQGRSPGKRRMWRRMGI